MLAQHLPVFRFNYDIGDNITKLIVMLPYAETDQYQTIRESEYGDATLATSPEGVQRYWIILNNCLLLTA